MKINFGWQMLLVLVALAVAVYVYVKGKAVATKLVTQTLNPASDKNIVYGGVNSVVQAITGNETATLGTSIYDAFHDSCGNLKAPSWLGGDLFYTPCEKRITITDGARIGGPKTVFKTYGTSEGE